MDLNKQSPVEFLGDAGCIRYFNNAQGLRLCSYFWPAQQGAKGVVIVVHGHGSYVCFDYLKDRGPGNFTTYQDSWIQRLNQEGYAVCGIDHQGCGRSEGLRCYVESFQNYVTDLLQFSRMCLTLGVPSFDLHLPKYVCGMSLGGCVSLTAVLDAADLYAGAILISPMISLEKVARRGLNPYLRPVGSLLSMLIPETPLVSVNRNTKYAHLQEMFDADPNCYQEKTRVRSAQEYLRATERLVARQADITLPFIIFHSEGDSQTDPEGSKRLFLQAKSEDKTLGVVPPDRWHILMKEPGNQELLQQVIEWLDQRCVGIPAGRQTSTAAATTAAAANGAAAAAAPQPRTSAPPDGATAANGASRLSNGGADAVPAIADGTSGKMGEGIRPESITARID